MTGTPLRRPLAAALPPLAPAYVLATILLQQLQCGGDREQELAAAIDAWLYRQTQ